MSRFPFRVLLFLLLLFCVSPLFLYSAEQWNQFLGPEGNGQIPADSHIPIKWSETENVKWKTPLPGRAWSSPVIWDNQIWLANATENGAERFAICVDRETGQIVHNRLLVIDENPQFVNAINSHASPTCVIVENRVFVHFGYAGTFCLDTKTGETVWERRDLACEHLMGAGGSPIPYNDLLIFSADGSDLQFIIALDQKTGETVWQVNRSYDLEKLDPDVRKAFSTPLLAKVNWNGAERDILFSAGAHTGYAYDPRTGQEWAQYQYSGGFSNAAKPVIWNDRVIFNFGFDRPALLCFPLGKGGILTEADMLWSTRRNITPVPTPVVVGDYLYNVTATGVASCIDLKTGEVQWEKRLGGGVWSSPLASLGGVYFFSDSGTTTVLAAEPEKARILATSELENGCMGTPAISGDSIYIRTKEALYRIEHAIPTR